MKLLTTLALLCVCFAAYAQENATEGETDRRILSAYQGLDPLPARATRLCGMAPVAIPHNSNGSNGQMFKLADCVTHSG